MKVQSCLHPKVVFNRYLNRSVVARCGKCDACLNARAANWVQRIDQECFYTPYNFFVTFQYDEQHVQQFIRLRPEDNPNRLPSYINSLDGSIISLSDVDNITDKDIKYCNDTKILLVPDISDFQLFLKRLRKDIQKHYDNAKIRYFCTFEIGPTTFRPHAHCIFFVNSPLLAQDFGKLLDKHWQYGSVFDPHIINGSASQYVASYVNCLVNLPKIYLCKEIRPKSIFSKNPPIGYISKTLANRKELFFSKKDEIVIFKPLSKEFSYVPLWRALRNNLYPFIAKFGSLSYLDRVALYRLGSWYDKLGFWFGLRSLRRALEYRPYFTTFYTPIKGTKYFEYNENSFLRFARLIRKAYENATSFGISIEYYVYLMSEFYDSCAQHQLADYFRAQDDYFKNHPLSDFLLFNYDFCKKVNNKFYSMLEPWQRYYLDLYLPNLDKSKRITLNSTKSFAYNELNKLHRKIASDNTKTKLNIDYLISKKSEFLNVINYYDLKL